MSPYNFSKTPQKTESVKTRYRTIKTELPHRGYSRIFKDLEKYESRSMHGQLPVVWDRAEDFRVFDKYGNRWIDFTSTIFVANAGHANKRIIKAIESQINQGLLHTYTFASEIRAKFLKKLIEISPRYLEKAFLLSSGTEAAECAFKLMRMRGQKIKSMKVAIISFKGSMHGRTMAAEMMKGDPDLSAWIGYKDPNVYQLPFPYPWKPARFEKDMRGLKEKGLKFENICGFMIESYQGWGAIFYPRDYIQELFRFARKYNSLVAFDDIQGGFGRTGRLFAYQHYGVEPDLVCLGKGLSGGLPLSAVLGRREIMDIPEVGSMSSTHSANPLSCAAALANIEEIKSRNLVKESARKGKMMHLALGGLKKKYPEYISYVFGKGLLAAIIIKNPRTGRPDGSIASRICEKAMQKGLLLVHTARESIKIGPPLTIPEGALIEGIRVLDECLSDIKKEEVL